MRYVLSFLPTYCMVVVFFFILTPRVTHHCPTGLISSATSQTCHKGVTVDSN